MSPQVKGAQRYFARPPIHLETHPELEDVGVVKFPMAKSFWTRLFAQAPDYSVVLTYGAWRLQAPETEFLAAGIDWSPEKERAAFQALHALLSYAAGSDLVLGPGDTLDLSESLPADYPMKVMLLLPLPDPIRESGLVKHLAPAKAVLSLVPITPSELEIKKDQGLEALLDSLENAGASTIFDFERK